MNKLHSKVKSDKIMKESHELLRTRKCMNCGRDTMKWKDYHYVCSHCGFKELSDYTR